MKLYFKSYFFKFINFIIFQFCFFCLIYSDQITVFNMTSEPIYTGIFKVKKKTADRFGDSKEIKPGNKEKLNIPNFSLAYDRELVFSLRKEDFENSILKIDEYSLKGHVNVGIGNDFYIAYSPAGVLKGYNYAQWKLLKPVKDTIASKAPVLYTPFDKLRNSFSKHAYGTKVANVRLGSDISQEEKNYLLLRKKIAKTALENFLGQKIDSNKMVNIGFALSGGGIRAVIGMMGSLSAAQEIGLLDSSIYISGLSGSEWGMAAWYSSNIQSLNDIKKKIFAQLVSSPFKLGLPIDLITNSLLKKFVFSEPITLVDIYGDIVSSQLLSWVSSNIYNLTLEQQLKSIENGKMPFPIYNAVVTKKPYEWVEFNPIETGSDNLGGYVPTWSFGRKFSKGQSLDFAPPQNLPFYMGIWGSAFSANLKEIVQNVESKISVKAIRDSIKNNLEATDFGKVRANPAKVFNYTYGLLKLPRGQQKYLTLIDAGIDFNLPLPPLLKSERDLDIIIILDYSSTEHLGTELKKLQKYCTERCIKLPEISLRDINRPCSVFHSSDPLVPTLIYMPAISNPGSPVNTKECLKSYCSTYNFEYTLAQSEGYAKVMELNMRQSKNDIVNAIKRRINLKK